ncbi:MAG: hypothetical protein FWE22_06185 [Firmicutes bacterium]|nr:hypothetical protein [Bacillota bacterium]
MLFWKIKRLVGFVMFIAAIVTLIVFFMNLGNVAEAFRYAEGFGGYMDALHFVVRLLYIPLILFALGLICMLLPRPRRDD